MNAPLPLNEYARLAVLESYRILDTASDEAFDRITRLASTILRCPISVISAAKSFNSPLFRATKLSWKLLCASKIAKARPIPREAPVMRAVGREFDI